MRCLTFLLACLLLSLRVAAQVITGIITDEESGAPLPNVSVENVYTHAVLVNDNDGHFSISAARGQLLEFRRLGYKVARVRLPAGALPPFFKIQMSKGAYELDGATVRDKYRNYHNDSIRNHAIYKTELEFPELTGLDVIRHPFSALSKRNRQIWAFQKEYTAFEKEKYIDYTFNDKLITNITGLRGDSVMAYQKAFRPSYDMLRNISEYDFLMYIKRTAAAFRGNGGRAMRQVVVPERE